jgi:hypothetical protein
MNRKHLVSLGFVVASAALFAAGCSSKSAVSGSISAASGKTVPDAAAVDIVWGVSATSPDYAYAFGHGATTKESFELDLSADPPAEALNGGVLGVGNIVLVPTGKEPKEGKLAEADQTAIEGSALGASTDYVVIFKKGTGKPDKSTLTWPDKFSEGYSCGKVVRATAGMTFDTFEPVDCATVTIKIDDWKNLNFPNWT